MGDWGSLEHHRGPPPGFPLDSSCRRRLRSSSFRAIIEPRFQLTRLEGRKAFPPFIAAASRGVLYIQKSVQFMIKFSSSATSKGTSRSSSESRFCDYRMSWRPREKRGGAEIGEQTMPLPLRESKLGNVRYWPNKYFTIPIYPPE